ncbi:uncharacterized protein LOC135073500 [Ostrinia nubilalis]|uniref:uncharacterized protein LOC135073500 n=1 Tax=Ostrinia nubilalis TaxID=29057 RepID=UPI0030826507
MSVKRSPSKSHKGSTFTGSHTDADCEATDSNSQITQRRRKQPDSDILKRADLVDFKKEMMTILQDIKESNSDFMRTIRSEISEIKTQVSSVTKTLDNITQQQSQFRHERTDLSQSLNFHTKSFDDLRTKTQEMSKEITQVKSLSKEVDIYNRRIANLERDFNIQQQRERLNNIELAGVPENNKEDLAQLLLSICEILGVQASKDDIVSIHRVPKKLPNAKSPKNIIAKMSSQLIKDKIISAIRRKKGLTTNDLGLTPSSDPRRIYINEHLTPFFKMIHTKTRETAAGAAYQHVWIRNGKIFVRKNDASPAINIVDVMDLGKIK